MKLAFKFLLLFCIFSNFLASDLALANLKCNDITAVESLEKKFPDALKTVIKKLKSVPEFLYAAQPPTYEQLMSLKNYTHDKTLPLAKVASTDSLLAVLALFSFMKTDTEYYFIGNGYYAPYLIAKSLFAGTEMESRINFLPFSRPLAELANNEPKKVRKYFKSLNIGKHKDRKIIVIDSTTTSNTPNQHSVLRVASAIRQYLVSEKWSLREALDTVVAVGMPESTTNQNYKTTELSDYWSKTKEINEDNFEIYNYPYYDPKMVWNQTPFIDSYTNGKESYYWNGKYNKFGRNGLPEGYKNFEKNINEMSSTSDFKTLLTDRYQLVERYLKTITDVATNKNTVKNEINIILSNHNLQQVSITKKTEAPELTTDEQKIENKKLVIEYENIEFENANQVRALNNFKNGNLKTLKIVPFIENIEWNEFMSRLPTIQKELKSYGLKVVEFTSIDNLEIKFDKIPGKSQLITKALKKSKNRKLILKDLEKLLAELADNQIYISGLRPRDLVWAEGKGIFFLSADSINKVKYPGKVYKRYSDKFETHWKSDLTSEELNSILNFLKTELNQLNDEAA